MPGSWLNGADRQRRWNGRSQIRTELTCHADRARGQPRELVTLRPLVTRVARPGLRPGRAFVADVLSARVL